MTRHLNYTMMAHGGFEGAIFQLPKNVRVIMMSQNSVMMINNHNLGKAWLIALSTLKDDLKIDSNISKFDSGDKLDSQYLDEYLLNNEIDVNPNCLNRPSDFSFALYSGNIAPIGFCPDISFTDDNDSFRTGIYQMPALVDRYDTKTQKKTSASTQTIKSIIFNNLKAREIHQKSNIDYIDCDFGQLVGSLIYPKASEKFFKKGISLVNNPSTHLDLLDKTKETKLSSIIEKIVETNPTRFVTIIIFCCRYTSDEFNKKMTLLKKNLGSPEKIDGVENIEDLLLGIESISLKNYRTKLYKDNMTYMEYDYLLHPL
ncbi:MAG: hypothetical protein Harvfovirus1_84 [Harvfovirus sp.]|uniref:Uncharacterized protein n=1 Tax=Harvfovirus sp. TaxID=2487768 RepID=A0A3G5A4R3_9VIRU|nr:MAG: hypothetical protein Harvfovirus1_84 [Harvfovirus sp.]